MKIITGTGRCGTTFLVKLLDQLGLTSVADASRYDEKRSGGYEWTYGDLFPIKHYITTSGGRGAMGAKWKRQLTEDGTQKYKLVMNYDPERLEYRPPASPIEFEERYIPDIIKDPRMFFGDLKRLNERLISDTDPPATIDHVWICYRPYEDVAKSRIKHDNIWYRYGECVTFSDRSVHDRMVEFCKQGERLTYQYLAECEIPHTIIDYYKMMDDPQYLYELLIETFPTLCEKRFKKEYLKLRDPAKVTKF